jgi:hypothetical protein
MENALDELYQTFVQSKLLHMIQNVYSITADKLLLILAITK